jgi:glucose/arabinose dehydrogenase
MKNLLLVSAFLLLSSALFSQAANNTCATATNLGTVNGDCTNTAGDLYLANQTTNPTGSCSGGNRYDVWYRFTMPATSTFAAITVSITSNPTSLANNSTFIEVFNTNATCNLTSTSLGCGDISTTRRYTGLTPGGTYTFRIYVNGNPNVAAGRYNFNVCVTSNDECATATTVTPGTTIDGNVFSASNSSVAVAPCTGTADDDVWYKFTALYSYATINLHNIGSQLASSGARMQLFSGTCGTLANAACMGTATTINATGLTVGATYFLRVYSAGNNQTGFNTGNSGFRLSITPSAPVVVGSSRMKEVYHQQIISAPQVLADPWEVTYGPDNNLWITESKGYRVYRYNPTTGVRDTVLNISQGSTFLPVPDQTFNCQFNNGTGAQGGLAGLAIHPLFLDATTPVNYVYISYIHSQTNANVFTNRVVRFTYNTGTGKLESPVSLCDTLPGSNDHNSQRMIIKPMTTGGTDYYLFYSSGDMGAGQFGNAMRTQKAQFLNSYEGKILRFNLVSDGDAGLNAWIPNTNPFNATLGVQSAVWATGIRNNQGLAYDPALNLLYGASHGPFSDDEINVLETGKNYGHPLVIGYAADDNVNGTTAGAAPGMSPAHPSSCPVITDESNNAAALTDYKDPLFAAYPNSTMFPSINTLWNTTPTIPGNGNWPSEGWSGLDVYTHTLVPGWKKSLVAASLKWGRLVRLRLNSAGTATAPTNTAADTVSYFGGVNRFRDLAFAPNGKDIYVVMDRSTSTSGPSALYPVVPACAGCLQKYTFLGYADVAGKSSIPTSIDVTSGTVNTCNPGTTVTIDASNNTLWVPITGPDGNIMAEINAMGQNLGTITSSFYQHSGAIRIKNNARYLDRNITITPQTQPSSPVKIRLYISKAEYDALDLDPASMVSAITDLRILKNNDACGSAAVAATTSIVPAFAEAHGSQGYMLQGSISSFSSFYFGSTALTLPLDLLTFTGSLQTDNTVMLKWKTENEVNTSHFEVERSIDGSSFSAIGTVAADNNPSTTHNYSYIDMDAANQQSLILYYRLKMVDANGAYSYSNIISVLFNDITGTVIVNPNPVLSTAQVRITAPAPGKIQWKLLDNAGRSVDQNFMQVRKGSGNSFTINMDKFAAGVYYLKVTGAGIDQKIKIQKL